MSIKPAERLLFMLQVSNASFPTGAFNHSYGFETWIDSELINDGSSFEVACRQALTAPRWRMRTGPCRPAISTHLWR